MKVHRFVSKLFRIGPFLKQTVYTSWNRLFFRMTGIQYGRSLVVHDKLYVVNRGTIKVGDDFHFTSGDCINPLCRNLRGVMYTMTDSARIDIGDRVGISSSCLWAKERITIGNDVNIGGDCILMDNDAHPVDYLHRRGSYLKEVGWDDYYKTIGTAPIEIGDDVWIGARSIILKGVHIGQRSIIAAGSVVTKNIPSDVVAGGNPCKVIRSLNQ